MKRLCAHSTHSPNPLCVLPNERFNYVYIKTKLINYHFYPYHHSLESSSSSFSFASLLFVCKACDWLHCVHNSVCVCGRVAGVEKLMCRFAILIECKQACMHTNPRGNAETHSSEWAFTKRNESDMQLVCELLITTHFSPSSSSFSHPPHMLALFSRYLISFTTQLEPHTHLFVDEFTSLDMAMNT
jgi:hypothetical protein